MGWDAAFESINKVGAVGKKLKVQAMKDFMAEVSDKLDAQAVKEK